MLLPNAQISSIETGLDWKTLAALPDTCHTAYGSMLKLQIRSSDRVLELIGPATLRNRFDHIAERGIVCNTGLLGNQWYLNGFDPIMELKNDSYLTSFYSGLVNTERLNALFAYVDQYNVRVPIERVFSLSEVADAHRFLQSEHSFGKVIVLND